MEKNENAIAVLNRINLQLDRMLSAGFADGSKLTHIFSMVVPVFSSNCHKAAIELKKTASREVEL